MKVTDDMVNRFLGWRLPKDFSPDHYISFDRAEAENLRDRTNGTSWPIGTNLLNADQAKAMLEYVLCVAPSAGECSEGYPGIAHDLETMRSALTELVALKDMKEALADHAAGVKLLPGAEWFEKNECYRDRKPKAWQIARNALKNAAPQGSAGTHRTDPAGPVADDAHAPAGAAPFTVAVASGETPRTDAACFKAYREDGMPLSNYVVDGLFACQLERELAVANENRRLQADAIRDYERELAEANRRAHYEATWHNHYALKEQSASSTESSEDGMRCEQCDPSFGCFAGSKPCSKVAPSSTAVASDQTRKLLQDIRYEVQRVMMGARWERAYFTRLLERIGEALSAAPSATGHNDAE